MNNYIRGQKSEIFAEELIGTGRYDEAFEYLDKLIFTNNPEEGIIYITEKNMLMYMILEIGKIEGSYRNTSTEEFKRVLVKIRFILRRLWLRFQDDSWYAKAIDYLNRADVSSATIAVIAKYCLPKESVVFTLECVKLLVNENKQVELDYFISQLKLNGYIFGLQNNYIGTKKYDEFLMREIDCNDMPNNKSIECINDKKVAIIYCANDSEYIEEINYYLKFIRIPKGFEGEILVVKNAPSMCAGYNVAMACTDAKYKVYIHQDTFIIDENLIINCIKHMEENDNLKMLGVAGCKNLPESGKWWSAKDEDKKMCVYQDAIMQFIRSNSGASEQGYSKVNAIDGIFIMTSDDIRWNEELFDGWHFYDISQTTEFIRRGYDAAIIEPGYPCIIHEMTMKKDPDNLYDIYAKKFTNEYL